MQDDELGLITLIGLAGQPATSTLLSLCRAARIKETDDRAFTTDSLRGLVRRLSEELPIELGEQGLQVSAQLLTLVLRESARRGNLSELGIIVRDVTGRGYYGASNPEVAHLELLVCLHTEQHSKAYERLTWLKDLAPNGYSTAEPIFNVVCNPFDLEWMNSLPPKTRGWLVPEAIARALRLGDCPDGFHDWLQEHSAECEPEVRCAIGDLAFLRGDRDALRASVEDTHHSLYRMRQLALLCLYDGDVQGARDAFEDYCTRLKEGSRRRLVPADGLAGVAHALCLLGSSDPEHREQAERYAAAAVRERHAAFGASLNALRQACFRAVGSDDAPVRAAIQEDDCLVPLMTGLEVLWFEANARERARALETVKASRRQLKLSPRSWLAMQLAHVESRLGVLLASTEREARSRSEPMPGIASADLGSAPHPDGAHGAFLLAELSTVDTDWSGALQALERIVSVVETEVTTPRRVVWHFRPETLEIAAYLQRQQRSGLWSGGRRVALKQLCAGGELHDLLSERDRKIVEFVQFQDDGGGRGRRQRYHLPERAIAALIDHPLVVDAAHPERPLEVARGHLSFVATDRDGGLRVETVPPQIEQPFFVETSLRRVSVFALSAEQFRMAQVIGAGLDVPPEGRQQTLDVLSKLSKAVPIQSSGGVGAAVDRVEADSALWLRLIPNGFEMSVVASLRPFGGSGPLFIPGEGGQVVTAVVDGEVCEAVRSHKDELDALDELEAACPALEGAAIHSHEWLVEGADRCLAFVAELQSYAGGVRVEWARSAPVQVGSRLGLSALRGRLTTERGWYLASGSFRLDDKRAIELKDLVRRYEEHPGRFVQLEDGQYLELEQELRQMLAALSAVRDDSDDADGEAVFLPACAINALAYFDDESSFQLDGTVTEQRERLRRAYAEQFVVPQGLKAELRAYQVEGFRWLARLAEVGFGACLADDMGLGKTVQLLALLLHRSQLGPALVVAPTSVCPNWQHEAERFAPGLEVVDFSGAERVLGEPIAGQIVLTSYTLMQQDIERLHGINWGTIVLDEAQFIKNPQSARARAAFLLQAQARVAATGTPLENHLGDLWSIFRFLNPGLLRSWPAFSRKFVLPIETEVNAEVRGQLKTTVEPFILRRTKRQVLAELPPLTEVTLEVELSDDEKELYEITRQRALEKLQSTRKERRDDSRMRLQVLAEITRLRRLCCHPALVYPSTTVASSKLDAFANLVGRLVEEEHRVLVFSQFVDVLGYARQVLESAGITYRYLDGSTPGKVRQQRVAEFQAGEADVFLISLKAGGFGLNLTAADYVIHIDPWWNPAAEAQASDRAHRIGQVRPVTVYRLIAKHTVEQRIVGLHERKRDLADSLLADAGRATTVSADELENLLG